MSKDRLYTLPMEMYKFNFEICSHLTWIFKYESGSYPYIDIMFRNFTIAFTSLWETQEKTQWHLNTKSFILSKSRSITIIQQNI